MYMAGVGCTYSLTQIAIKSVSCHANASGFFGVSYARHQAGSDDTVSPRYATGSGPDPSALVTG